MATSKTIDQNGAPVEETAIVPVQSDGRVFSEIALALHRDREVAQAATVALAETTVLMLGASELDRVRKAHLPSPQEGETMSAYINRITPLLKPDELGKMQDMGLVAMLRLGKFSTLGLEFRLYGALLDGSWRHSPNAGNDYQAWVRHIIMDQMNMSAATASRYSNGCMMLKWLYEHKDEVGIKLPEHPEACFTGEFSLFSGVTRTLPRLNRAIRVTRDQTAKDDEHFAALDEIKETIELLQNPDTDKTKAEQEGRAGTPRIEPIRFVVKTGTQVATYDVTAENITFEQLSKAQVSMKGAAEWALPGQADSDMVTVQYKRVAVPVCPVCEGASIDLYSLLQEAFPQYGCPVCEGFFGGDESEQSKYDMSKDVTLPDPLFRDEWYYRSKATGNEWIMLEGDPRSTMTKDERQVGTAQVDNLFGIPTTIYTYRRKVDWMERL